MTAVFMALNILIVRFRVRASCGLIGGYRLIWKNTAYFRVEEVRQWKRKA
jgi:hypothetical protein